MTKSAKHAAVEGMGLRLEPTSRIRPTGVWGRLALLMSSAGWLWLAGAGADAPLVVFLTTSVGGCLAAGVSALSALAVVRALPRRG